VKTTAITGGTKGIEHLSHNVVNYPGVCIKAEKERQFF
jgi:hypothetical protein